MRSWNAQKWHSRGDGCCWQRKSHWDRQDWNAFSPPRTPASALLTFVTLKGWVCSIPIIPGTILESEPLFPNEN